MVRNNLSAVVLKLNKTRLLGIVVGLAGITGAYYAWASLRASRSVDGRTEQNVLRLSWRLAIYAQMHGHLPSSLADLGGGESASVSASPFGKGYVYQVLGKNKFRLCATFKSQSEQFSQYPGKVFYGDPVTHNYGFWVHGEGVQCLDRVVPITRE